VNGLPVLPLDRVPAKVDYFVIASYIYAGEIKTILETWYPNKNARPMFFDFSINGVAGRPSGISEGR